ncbi:hypothetical protein HK097_001963 [Rhizophlyctis rosea]|uniref:Uncharacterized protein n=1 Tax=Rhizophlyctis rosea TaxID=64517 RepID=A0AAD5S6N4_9FUNG|nr:hypothetical protein HK097_001963 [Rhizophlyctis rosea]
MSDSESELIKNLVNRHMAPKGVMTEEEVEAADDVPERATVKPKKKRQASEKQANHLAKAREKAAEARRSQAQERRAKKEAEQKEARKRDLELVAETKIQDMMKKMEELRGAEPQKKKKAALPTEESDSDSAFTSEAIKIRREKERIADREEKKLEKAEKKVATARKDAEKEALRVKKEADKPKKKQRGDTLREALSEAEQEAEARKVQKRAPRTRKQAVADDGYGPTNNGFVSYWADY